MSFATRFASLGGTRGLATALAVLVSAPVLAQTAPAQPAPAQTAPAQRPAAPAAQPARPAAPTAQPARPAAPAQAQGAQPQQNAGPTVVQVKAEPSQPEWTKVCGKDQNTNTEICYTTRDFVSDQGQPVLALAVYDVKGAQPQKVARFVMPLGLLLQPGLRFTVDQGQAVAGRYVMCLPNGCFAEAQVKDDFIAALKKGANLNVSVQNQMGREITFAVPAAGFGKAFDGPPIDPKVLEEQQKKLQEELQKKSEEMRQRMLQSQGTPAAPGATAPAAQAAPKP
ncbi:invasion associated locus B family protein [Microvirga arabica]|uniref:invasion associated locus B family protein n=2 Tax=Microvirga arabica TaxID=1128671 RepID=UPI00193A8580|nr:invasion associated locus B family protein [Microvirga arabica]MBM1172276.1 invasion associated locus B family protein [Microvirga arabica]